MVVYPRWRGELSSSARIMPAAGGLSPLARGTRYCLATNVSLRRFIPAGAGNSVVTRRPLLKKTVYPRWRGELVWRESASDVRRGLSPLARGTRY
ncbi:hypothetical protein ECSTECMHI813_3017 [Escherichia coli STEC_MHI813]|nr:hypothetical protein ECSTECMHI813_3017 [Escherichia coli STEC_MHI813]